MSLTRRTRGAVLRLVRQRGRSIAVGLVLAVPSAWVEFSGGRFPLWMQGLALVAGATGIALIWTGMTGVSPDWIESDEPDVRPGRPPADRDSRP